MYVIRADGLILCSDEVMNMMKTYREKFGEPFISFNYVDFPGTDDMRPAQQYKETLQKALKKDTPTRIESHRYDTMDH